MLVTSVANESSFTTTVLADPRTSLTRRETDVLKLLADGLTTKAVAAELKLSFKTAACHRYHVLQKLGVQSTVSAVRWAIREGIVTA